MNNSTLETSDFVSQKILGWHFSEDTKLGYDDNRLIIIGETLSVEDEIIPCQHGLHASKKALDAFYYMRGNYLWRVELEGDLQSHTNSNGITDKWVARSRKVLAGGDATEMLLKFGRECALETIHLLPNAPKEVKTFLETGVMTKTVKKYFSNNINVYDSAYSSCVYSTYLACKRYNAYNVYNTIYYAAKALNVPFETYTDKFEQACLDFISEKS